MYTHCVHQKGNSLAIMACIGLVAMQLSGVHMHLDADGYVGALEGAHHHSHGEHHEHHQQPGDTDYEDTQDVSVLELSGGASKVVLAILGLSFLLPFVLRDRASGRPVLAVRRLGAGQSRWRPPLRAPPQQL